MNGSKYGRHAVAREDAKEFLRRDHPLFDACLCDPPYHLVPHGSNASSGFMDKRWDGGQIAFDPDLWRLVYSRLKPGASVLAFGGRRTFHRMACAMEDAGFQIMDVIAWIFSQAKPVSVDISKAIDDKAGATREVVGRYRPPGMKGEWNLKNAADERSVGIFSSSRNHLEITAPATADAKTWDGYGTALKPCYEPVVWCMKPCEGTYVENALSLGVAGLNVDGCRIPTDDELKGGSGGLFSHERDLKAYPGKGTYRPSAKGRWPGDLILDEATARMADIQHNGASAFYYCAKVSRSEREAGLESLHEKQMYWSSGDENPGAFQHQNTKKSARNHHPTLKPLSLTTYLALMLLPPAGRDPRRLLVPFSGAGSEMIGGLLAGWDDVTGVENGGGDEATAGEYVRISEARISHWTARPADAGSLFDSQEAT